MLKPLKLKFSRLKRSLIFQYCVYLLFATALSVFLSPIFFRDIRTEARSQYAVILSDLIQYDLATQTTRPLHSERIIRLLRHYGMDAWEVNAQGQVIASTSASPLPIEWSTDVLPTEEMAVSWSKTSWLHISDVAAVRLIGVEPRYLIYQFQRLDSRIATVTRYILYLFCWVYFVSALGALFVFRWREGDKQQIGKPIDSEAGFSLLSAIVTLVLVSITAVAVQKLLASAFRGSAHTDLRQAVRSLSDTVKGKVDCAKTFEGLDVATVCRTSQPILLRNNSGTPLTEPLISSEKDTAFAGAGKIGNWYLRATCEDGTANLWVRFARKGSSTEKPFYVDPLTGRPYDFSDSSSNPLFGSSDRQLCRGLTAGSARPFGFLGSQSYQKGRYDDFKLQITDIPTNTQMVKIHLEGVNLGDLDTKEDEYNEDQLDIHATLNLAAMSSTGFFRMLAGKGEKNTALFSWKNQPSHLPITINGNAHLGGIIKANPSVPTAARWRPVFDYSREKRTLSMDVPEYTPASYSILVEFYGD